MLFTVEMAMRFQDCYKTIIGDLSDWNLGGGIIDDCDESNDEDVTVFTYDFTSVGLSSDISGSFIETSTTITRDTAYCTYFGDIIGAFGFNP